MSKSFSDHKSDEAAPASLISRAVDPSVGSSPKRRRSIQAPSAVVMIRPHHFTPNPETASDNAFQPPADDTLDRQLVERAAFDEVSRAIARLEGLGVTVHVFDDYQYDTPDSVFPNNWFSTHPGGHVAVFPMFTPNRRIERRVDIIEMLKREYRVQDIIDYSGLEYDGLYLEGTGAMVIDHVDRVAYVARTNRADPVSLERFCTHFNYEPMAFDAYDESGVPIYHTNVLMCIATEFVLIGLDAIPDSKRREEIRARFEASGREVISVTYNQLRNFAGNAMELYGSEGHLLALSKRALESLQPHQIEVIEDSASIVPLEVPTIELGGGSVRCMLAGIHLSRR